MKAMMYTAPVLDTVLTIEGTYPLSDGQIYGILDERHSIGGPCTTIVGAKRLGVEMFPVGTIGPDETGKRCCEQFSAEGISREGLEVRDGYKTRQVIGVVDSNTKHSYLYDPKLAICPLNFCRKFIDQVKLAGFSGYTMTTEPGNEGNAACTLEVMRYCREKGVITILDPGALLSTIPEEILREACCLMDYIMLNDEEARFLSGMKDGDPISCGKEIARKYGGVAIVKDGGRGAAWCTADHGTMYPAFSVKVVNTNGAGDTFQAGFIYGLLSEKPEAEIMRYAAGAAALKVATGGAADGTPTLEEVERFLDGQ